MKTFMKSIPIHIYEVRPRNDQAKVSFEPVSALRLQPGVSASREPQSNAIKVIFFIQTNTRATLSLAKLDLSS